MINSEFKNQILDIYNYSHQYTYHILSDLNEDTVNWVPNNTKGRSIYSYFRHLVNVEIWWLYAFGKPDIWYVEEKDKVSFNNLIGKYKRLEKIYNQLVNDASEKDMEILETKMEDNYSEFVHSKDSTYEVKIAQRGTVAWTTIRISLHCLGHISQMTYILNCLGIHKEKHPDYNWWNMTEKFIALGNLAKIQ